MSWHCQFQYRGDAPRMRYKHRAVSLDALLAWIAKQPCIEVFHIWEGP